MAKRKNWTEEEIRRARPYLRERLAGTVTPEEFNFKMDSAAVTHAIECLYLCESSAAMNEWADAYLSQRGWTRLLNFLRVQNHRKEEKAKKEEKGEEQVDEEKADAKARKDALDYVSRLSADELAAFLKAADEKQKRRARRERQKRKEEARAEQQKREREERQRQHREQGRRRAYNNFNYGGAGRQYTVKECKAALNKCHPDKGGNEAEAKLWTERLEEARKRERATA